MFGIGTVVWIYKDDTFNCLKTNENSYTAVFHLFFLILTYALGLIANSFLCIILIFNCSITGKADLAEKYCRSFNSVYPSVCLPMCQNANLKRKLFYIYQCTCYINILYRLLVYEIFIHSLLFTYKLLVLKPDNSGCLKTFSCVNIHVVFRFQSYWGKYKFQ